MKRKQFAPLEIETYTADTYPLPTHSHTYYELIYILKGSGKHHVNSIIVPYKGGDLFLISPDDQHHFAVAKSTTFCFIKFTDSYFEENKQLLPDLFKQTLPTAIMRHPNLKEGKLKFNETYAILLRKTVQYISIHEKLQIALHSPILFFQILSIFLLIWESELLPNEDTHQKQLNRENIIYYIHQEIYHPTKIRIKNIAAAFNIAPNYFSLYFKQKFGTSYKAYTDQYKIKLIENRLLSRKMTMKQISYEFGFVDESHFNNYFKKRKGTTPGEYRTNNT
ncbi:helix-turn-helix domain-containing protein [Sphingobacterium sp. LRF_L2]|uniref:helix-turn-helix domain-containing protein n=1 Tax=Sphingobacterium sp. LRF_L2 TaxID=3369421 RepID=UPI003F60FD44